MILKSTKNTSDEADRCACLIIINFEVIYIESNHIITVRNKSYNIISYFLT